MTCNVLSGTLNSTQSVSLPPNLNAVVAISRVCQQLNYIMAIKCFCSTAIREPQMSYVGLDRTQTCMDHPYERLTPLPLLQRHFFSDPDELACYSYLLFPATPLLCQLLSK